MSESPENAELFNYYDELLSQENQILEQQRLPETNLIFENIDLIVNNGTLIREWNKTTTSNGTEFITICQSYSLEINGTTLNAVKVTIISSNGTVIQDPYIMIRKTDLIFWTGYWQTVTYYVPVWTIFGIIWIPKTELWWIPVPILYGYDFACFVHFPLPEKVLWMSDIVYELSQNPGYSVAGTFVSGAISGITAAVLLNLFPGVGQVASAIAGLVIALVVATANPIANIPQDLYQKIITVENINDVVDPEWGWRFYEYVHAPLTPR